MIIDYHFKTIKQKIENNFKKMKLKTTKKLHKTYTKILWTQNCTLDQFQSFRIILRSVDTIQYPHTNQYPTLIPCIYLIHDMHRLGSRNTIYVLLLFFLKGI